MYIRPYRLPNIRGTIGTPENAVSTTSMYINDMNLDGAFRVLDSAGYSYWTGGVGGYDYKRAAAFDASRSDDIYTDGSNICPLSFSLSWIVHI